MIYMLLFFTLAFLSFFEFCGSEELRVVKKLPLDRIAFVYIAFIMFCVAGFRYRTGRDWQNYLSFFDKCISLGDKYSFEKGFSFVNRFFKRYFDNFYVMQFFILAFCCLCVYKSFYKRSVYPNLTLFLYFTMYFLQTDMAQTRQHIAMAVLLCGMSFIEKRKLIFWCVVVFLAMQFHITALLAFPLYFTLNKQISAPISILLLLFCCVITFFGFSVIRGMLALVTLLPFVPERIRIIGNSYLNSTIYGQQSQFGTGLGFVVRYIFIALMIFFYAFGKNKEASEKNYYFLNFFIGLIFQAMGRNFDQFGRIANYYLICGGGLCAYNLLIDCKSFFRKTNVVRLGMCTMFLLFMAYNFYNTWTSKPKFFNSYKDDYTPYKSVLFENKDI